MVGDKIFDAFYPDRYYNHDAEDPDGIVGAGAARATASWWPINRRAAESDLVIYVNINFVPMDGGHKSVGAGLATTRACSAHHTPQDHPRLATSYMDPTQLAAAPVARAHRQGDRRAPEGLPHRDGAQQPHVRRADRVPRQERGRLHRARPAASSRRCVRARQDCRAPRAAKVFMRVPAGYEVIGVLRRRAPSPRTQRRWSAACEQYCVPVEGQARHRHLRHPVHLAVQRELAS